MLTDTSGKTLIFTREEYARRLECVRKDMAAKHIDLMLVHTFQNIFYLTGHQTFGLSNYHCLVVTHDDDPVLIVRQLESLLAKQCSWIDGFVLWQDHQDPIDVTLSAIGARKNVGVIGLEYDSPYLPASRAKRLELGITNARFVDASGIVERARRIKSAQEIDYMRRAAQITESGMQAAIDEVRAGRSENDVAAAATAAMYRAGSEFMAREPTVTSGPRSGIPHTTFCRRVLQKGDAILLEMSGCFNRYSAPLFRGVSVGRPRLELQRLADACVAALRAAIEAVRPGSTAGDVEKAYSAAMTRHGREAGKRAGYSIGIGFPPTWMEADIVSLAKGNQTILEPGMTLHIPAALREPQQWGAACSESVLVTRTGSELLTHFEQKLFVT